jgi:hypothetical protein
MNKAEVLSAVRVGDVFRNPQKGTSVVTGITDMYISYIRGKSTIKLPIDVFIAVVHDFTGAKCSSSDLRRYKPEIFDSHNQHGRKGHSCNCTFLFSIAEKMGLTVNGIQGKGVSGSPFYIVFRRD